jgi:hypothetical protein
MMCLQCHDPGVDILFFSHATSTVTLGGPNFDA